MKKNVLILFCFFVSLYGFSQANTLIGKWKVTSVNTDEVYYNAKTDSISLKTEELKEAFKDKTEIKSFIDLLKKTYTNDRFEFDGKGVLSRTSDIAGTEKFRYKNDTKRKIIIIKNLSDDVVNDEMPYEFKDGKLYLSKSLDVLFLLEKEK